MGWTGFALVFAAFFLTHSIPTRPAVKARITARIGARAFTLGYSALSLTMLALLIRAAGAAPRVALWPQLPWQRDAVLVAMLAVCLILALSLGRPNPFSFGGGQGQRFDPARPGLVRIERHPVLAALALWAGAHLLPNGDLAHVLLFGVLGGFALGGRALVDWRKRRDLGAAHWQALLAETRLAPVMQAPRSWTRLGLRLALGAAGFAALLWAHPLITGVAAR